MLQLRAFLPGGQIVFLLGCELVEFVAHAFELEARDFLVEILGHDVDLRLQLLVILAAGIRRTEPDWQSSYPLRRPDVLPR